MSAKRKAEAAMSPDGEGRASKRARGLNGDVVETAASVSQQGDDFIRSLKQAKDKTGRSIAKEFLTLPRRDVLPEYYDDIALPMALDMIEAKLRRQEYPTLTALESDAKRMIVNAKAYNDKSSVLYEDAERLRKTMSNWMTRFNPAYKDQSYVAIATPLPEGTTDITSTRGGAPNGVATPTPGVKKEGGGSIRLKLNSNRDKDKDKSSTPAPAPAVAAPAKQEQREGSKDFAGKTFQQAQDQIMVEMIKYKDSESNLEIFTPFVTLPSRQLEDYYQTIRHPVSLKSVQKRANGIHGRNPPTGISDFKSWDEYEQEVAYIWNNCRSYNEDGSEMYLLANEFEETFKERLADAKGAVDAPEQPRLKIKMGAPAAPIKLRLNAKDSPAPQSDRATPDSRGTPGMGVDAAALERQKAHVAAAVNGQRPPSAGMTALTPAPTQPISGSQQASTGAQPNGDAVRSASAASPPALTNGVKAESQPPAGSMPPPSLARIPSGSPHPQAGAVQPPALQHSSSYTSQSYYAPPPSNGFERRYREPGKTAKDALLQSLTLLSHPQLNLPQPVRMTIPASNRLLAQSVTVSLPPAHSYIQITPHVPIGLTNRPYRVWVTVNGQRMTEAVRQGVIISSDRTKPVYEGRLERGVVNRVEVEIMTSRELRPGESVGPRGAKEGVDAEKCTVFVHLMKS